MSIRLNTSSPFSWSLSFSGSDMPNPIEDDPKLAQAVGVLAGRFGLLEMMVEMTFLMLSGCSERKGSILFSFFKGVPTQCDAIKLLAKTEPAIGEEVQKHLSNVLKNYAELASLRNGVTHYPSDGTPMKKSPRSTKCAEPDLGQIFVKEPTGHEAVMDLADRVERLFQETIFLRAEISNALYGSLLQTPLQPLSSQTPEPSSESLLTYLFRDEEPLPRPQSSDQ